MPRFTQFDSPAAAWPAPILPAGQLRTNPLPPPPTPCTLPTNPRAGQPGVNDPYFATAADRTAWITANPVCTQPPPFLSDSPAANGQIKIALTPPSGASLPADLAVTVDGNPVTGSNGNYLVTGLADGPHTVKITGTGIQPVSGPVTTVSGTTVAMPVQLAPVPAPAPSPTPTPTPNPPAVVVQPAPTPGISWGTVLVTGLIVAGGTYLVMKNK